MNWRHRMSLESYNQFCDDLDEAERGDATLSDADVDEIDSAIQRFEEREEG